MRERPPPLLLLSRREKLGLLLGSLAFAAAFIYPLFCNNQFTGPVFRGWLDQSPHFKFTGGVPGDGDRDVFMNLRWVAYYTVAHYHQFPFWNPYKCGGMSLIGNPENGVLTPFLVFYVLFGLTSGVILEIYFHLAIMFAGGYVLGKELGLRPIACIAMAALFPSSSWLPLHIANGHLNFLSIAYVPWVLVMVAASCRTGRWYPAMLGGLLCALTLTEGNYGFVFALMLTAILSVWLAIATASFRSLVAAGLVGVFGLAFSTIKLIPVSEMLSIYPRDWGISFHMWWGVLVSIFSRNQDLNRPLTASFFFSEYGGYIGAPFVILALAGIFGKFRKAIPWIVGTYLFLLLYRGDTSSYALTQWLRLLPLGGNTGLCGRWVIPLVFCVGILAALGAEFLCELPGVWGRRAVLILIAAGIADAWIVCAPNYRYLLQNPWTAPFARDHFYQYWGNGIGGTVALNEANQGNVNCTCCGYYIPRGSVTGFNQPGYRGEYFLLGSGEVKQIEWTPNRLSYEVNASAPTSLIINQNMYPGWRVAEGAGSIYSYDGRIAIRVPAGPEKLEVLYRPTHIAWAFALTLLAALALILTWIRETFPLSAAVTVDADVPDSESYQKDRPRDE